MQVFNIRLQHAMFSTARIYFSPDYLNNLAQPGPMPKGLKVDFLRTKERDLRHPADRAAAAEDIYVLLVHLWLAAGKIGEQFEEQSVKLKVDMQKKPSHSQN